MKTRLRNELIANIAKDRYKNILDFLEVNIVEMPQGMGNIEVILVANNTNDFDRIYKERIEPTLMRYGIIHKVNFVDSEFHIFKHIFSIQRKYYIEAENHSYHIMRYDEINGTTSQWKIPFVNT